MKKFILIAALLCVTAVHAEESPEIPVPEQLPAPASVPTTPTLDTRLSSVESTTVQLYERAFRAEAKLLRIETILTSLEQRGLILTPVDMNGVLIEHGVQEKPVHIHRWRITKPAMVRQEGGKEKASAICHCGAFMYVETRSAPTGESK